MAEQLLAIAVLIALIFALNLIPVFAPPTWMALAFVGFQFPETDPWSLALVGAGAAAFGRLTLALFSHKIVGKTLLNTAQRTNIDVIGRRLADIRYFSILCFQAAAIELLVHCIWFDRFTAT